MTAEDDKLRYLPLISGKKGVTLKASIRTTADDIFCIIFPNFQTRGP